MIFPLNTFDLQQVRPLFAWCVQHGELAAARSLCRPELCGTVGAEMETQLAELLEAMDGHGVKVALDITKLSIHCFTNNYSYSNYREL